VICLAAVVATGTLAACGGPAADLFGVQRSGTIRGADLVIVPAADGLVTCDGHQHMLSSKQLLTAETFNVFWPAEHGTTLPSGPHPIYTYVVSTSSGTFSFSDDSPHITMLMRQLAAWVFMVDKTVCH
jgi:hypothetical protein